MDERVSSDDIAHLEAHIETLVVSIERCRKLSAAAKIAIGAGVAWIVLTLMWLVPYAAFMMVAAMAAIIGGIVLLGSNSTTWTQLEASLRASEAMRADMISRLDMRVVDDGVKRLH